MTQRSMLCARIGTRLRAAGEHLAIAESLTGGMAAQCFAAAPDSSDWFLGAVVAYQKRVKIQVLSVPEGPVLDEHDPDGATVAFERAQVAALLTAARAQQSDLDSALDRLRHGLGCARGVPS